MADLMQRMKLLTVRRHWFQQGQIAERERILAILESHDWLTSDGVIVINKVKED